jgi:hypothetical protein
MFKVDNVQCCDVIGPECEHRYRHVLQRNGTAFRRDNDFFEYG